MYTNLDRKRATEKTWNQRNPGYHSKYARAWRLRNPDYFRRKKREYHAQARLAALTHYSGDLPHCACCGELELKFLGIDHINGGGTKHREVTGRGSRLYLWLRKNGYPEGYQVLCHNCNMAKGFYGACPHQETKQ